MPTTVLRQAGFPPSADGYLPPVEGESEQILELERSGWQSLCDGTGDEFYGSIMTEDGRMVLANGAVMTRSDVAEALRQAPPWKSFDIDDPRITAIADDVVVLVYTGTGHRDEGDSISAVMSSVYVRGSTGWKLAHYQQTPLA